MGRIWSLRGTDAARLAAAHEALVALFGADAVPA
jgi:hypothetical protein